MTETNKDTSSSILKAAWLIAMVTIASKFMGFARDMVVANFYGATQVSDAYFYALQIPSLAIIILVCSIVNIINNKKQKKNNVN